MANKHMKRCLIPYVIRELQIKKTMGYHYTAIIIEWPKSKTLTAPNAGENVKQQEFIHWWWECKMVQPLWKMVWQFLTKLNILLPSSNHAPWHLSE